MVMAKVGTREHQRHATPERPNGTRSMSYTLSIYSKKNNQKIDKYKLDPTQMKNPRAISSSHFLEWDFSEVFSCHEKDFSLSFFFSNLHISLPKAQTRPVAPENNAGIFPPTTHVQHHFFASCFSIKWSRVRGKKKSTIILPAV